MANKDIREQITQDFKELMLRIDVDTPDETNNRIADIVTRVRSLYSVDLDD
ncbi:MAG: hypothetical protein ACR2LL_11820 [Nitrosopumilus sp.]|uniref:hypothetical protein n=1 Tax=Nitrosopumilus sp. TaxID=2024843 RepID=UPI00292E1658|nr:hypothetical protein [Nitrosopumilus sp.]